MKEKELREAVSLLSKPMELLSGTGMENKIRPVYAELYVAHKLSQNHDVQIGYERDNKNADIYLPDKKLRIEVKSGTEDASFTNGKQILKPKFDYCVFVSFKTHEEKDVFVFSVDELVEIARPRPETANHKTNACLLHWLSNYDRYEKYIKEHNSTFTDIEIKLHKNPENYREKWDKII